MSVVGSDGESVGTISDLLIGQEEAVQHTIVEVGGFLGFGAKIAASDLGHATFDESKIADIWAIIQVFDSSVSTDAEFGRTLLILVLPVLGLVIWFFMGPRSRGTALV